MRTWFPFTDYDFYAYLTSGGLLLVAIDYSLNQGAILNSDWSFLQIVAAIAAAYVAGHIIAMFSSVIYEHWLIGSLVKHPIDVQVGLKKQNWFDRYVIGSLAGRYYRPLSEAHRQEILDAVQAKTGGEPKREDIFRIGYGAARRDEDTRQRLDEFRNMYGFCRNISLSALISFGFTSLVGNDANSFLLIASGVVFLAMTFRYLKFYSSFAMEVVRSINKI
ncbi:MAG TPA: hypothetical protein EYN14_07315 [Alphaproteobacteria bacterium]|nr:hypothetical protein [Alphaproteobacteria bacterium]